MEQLGAQTPVERIIRVGETHDIYGIKVLVSRVETVEFLRVWGTDENKQSVFAIFPVGDLATEIALLELEKVEVGTMTLLHNNTRYTRRLPENVLAQEIIKQFNEGNAMRIIFIQHEKKEYCVGIQQFRRPYAELLRGIDFTTCSNQAHVAVNEPDKVVSIEAEKAPAAQPPLTETDRPTTKEEVEKTADVHTDLIEMSATETHSNLNEKSENTPHSNIKEERLGEESLEKDSTYSSVDEKLPVSSPDEARIRSLEARMNFLEFIEILRWLVIAVIFIFAADFI
jgi:hypothetical protein